MSDLKPAAGKQRRVVAIAIATVLVLASLLGGWYFFARQGNSSNSVVADGSTFYQALSSVNSSIANQPDGPWNLSQVFGIASPVPTSPSAFGWGQYNMTLNSCQSAFNGLTIWNGTIPLFHGAYNSGTAPFWQFVYFTNTTQQLLVVTDVLGTIHIYPPIADNSTCGRYSSLGSEPWRSGWTFYKWAFPANTPLMAAAAWSAVGEQYAAWLGDPTTEMYYMGDLSFGSGQPVGTQTKFFTCGTEGFVGMTPGLDVLTSPDDTSVVTGWYNYTIGCTPTYNYNLTPVPLRMHFGPTALVTLHLTTYASQVFQLWSVDSPTNIDGDSSGITTWMVNLTLSTSSNVSLPIGSSECQSWVASIDECIANTSGWYAVLLSGSGGWQASYGAPIGGAAWTYPVVPVASTQTLVIVAPATWNLSGDYLTVTSSTPELPLTGLSQL